MINHEIRKLMWLDWSTMASVCFIVCWADWCCARYAIEIVSLVVIFGQHEPPALRIPHYQDPEHRLSILDSVWYLAQSKCTQSGKLRNLICIKLADTRFQKYYQFTVNPVTSSKCFSSDDEVELLCWTIRIPPTLTKNKQRKLLLNTYCLFYGRLYTSQLE